MINQAPNHPNSYNHEDPLIEQLEQREYELNNSYAEMPTKLEMAISLFQKLGSSEAIGSVHPISVRIPTLEFASIQALAKHSGLSVNKVIVELLQVALDEVWQGMNEENRRALVDIRSEVLGKLIAPGASEGSKKGEI